MVSTRLTRRTLAFEVLRAFGAWGLHRVLYVGKMLAAETVSVMNQLRR